MDGFCISDTDKCSFSKIKPGTLLHLFFECRISRVIWNDVIDWISSSDFIFTNLDFQEICQPQMKHYCIFERCVYLKKINKKRTEIITYERNGK